MKPTAGERLVLSASVGCDAESEVRIRTPLWREMKPAISVGGRIGMAHSPTADEWGTSRRGLPGL
jgi:hypothetical protein